MIKRSKMIAGVLLFTMLLSGIPEGFGTVTTVYADEPLATVEKTEEPESGEQNPEDDDLKETAPSEDDKEVIEEQVPAKDQDADEKSSDSVEVTDKKEDTPADPEAATAKPEQKAEQKEETEKDKDAEKPEKEYPAFKQSKTADGVTVTVEAKEGVFPEGAKLSVTSVSSSETEKEVDKERDDKNVAVSYTFDIKVLDEEDNELQPAEDQNVKVSFRTAEVADPNLEVSVYHISEEEGAEELDVDVSGQTAVAESDGFSYYTVEFTYNDLQYVLAGDESVALSEILSAVGLVGEATEVTVSDPGLFSASKQNGKWIITAHKAFSSNEWMRVTIGDITYEITVTDDQTSGTCGNGLTWTLENGTLTISKTGDGDGKMSNWSSSPWDSSINSVVIGDGVTSIGSNAFAGCVSLTSINIPSSVTNIGEYAFAVCSLTSISIPSSVTNIGMHAFAGCARLTSISIPSSVTSIEMGAFSNCQSLTSIVIPSGVTSIESGAFGGCSSLTSIVIPSTVTNIGSNAFQNCPASLSVYFDGTQEQWNRISGDFPSNVNRVNVFTATPNPSAGGTIAVTSETTPPSRVAESDAFTYTPGQDVKLTATANNGWRFVSWTKNDTQVGTDAEYSFSAEVCTLVANFREQRSFAIDGSVSNHTYSGSAYNPAPTVKDGTTTLTKDTHYTLNYQRKTGTDTWSDVDAANVKDVGTYKVVVTGKNGTVYEGASTNAQFSITQRSVTITANDATKTYDGSALTQGAFSNSALEAGDTHTFVVAMTSDSTITNVGTQPNVIATVDGTAVTTGTATSIGNYLVTTANGTLTVNSKAVTITAQNKAFTYDGNAHSWPYYDVTGLVGSDAITATVTGSITSVNESPVTNVVSSYSFTSGMPENYSVTTRNGQLTMTGNPAPINPAPINPTPKHDDDNSHHEDSSSSSQTNNTRVPDGCDELRLILSSAIATAKVTGTPQTVYWNKGTSLPYDAMKTLHDNPMITLVFTYKYLGMDFAAVIPGSAAYATPAIQWYGPIYLYLLYGNTKVPAATGTYTIKSGDTLSGIAMKLNTTIQHLKNVNSIRNINEIKTGMALKY